MINLDDLIQRATEAMCKQQFAEADSILQKGLQNTDDSEEKEIILQHLVHLYEHPLNEQLDKAELFLSKRESLNPSAYAALAGAYFQTHSKRDDQAAAKWAEIAERRAAAEGDLGTLYSAAALSGLLAVRRGDLGAAQLALDRLGGLVGSSDMICYGDAIIFLESLKSSPGEVIAKVKPLARMIASKIEDPEFRTRADAIANLH